MKVGSVDPVQQSKIQEYTQRSATVEETKAQDPKQKQQDRVLNKLEYVTDFDKSNLEELDEAVKKLNDTATAFNIRLNFSVDERTDRLVVKVIEKDTDKVIREIPPEQVLNMVAQIQNMIGIFVDARR